MNLLADGGEMVDNSTQTPREDDVPNNAVEEENKGDKSFNKLWWSEFSGSWHQRSWMKEWKAREKIWMIKLK